MGTARGRASRGRPGLPRHGGVLERVSGWIMSPTSTSAPPPRLWSTAPSRGGWLSSRSVTSGVDHERMLAEQFITRGGSQTAGTCVPFCCCPPTRACCAGPFVLWGFGVPLSWCSSPAIAVAHSSISLRRRSRPARPGRCRQGGQAERSVPGAVASLLPARCVSGHDHAPWLDAGHAARDARLVVRARRLIRRSARRSGA